VPRCLLHSLPVSLSCFNRWPAIMGLGGSTCRALSRTGGRLFHYCYTLTTAVGSQPGCNQRTLTAGSIVAAHTATHAAGGLFSHLQYATTISARALNIAPLLFQLFLLNRSPTLPRPAFYILPRRLLKTHAARTPFAQPRDACRAMKNAPICAPTLRATPFERLSRHAVRCIVA